MLDPLLVEGYGPNPQILMACVVSMKPGLIHDDACLLHAGDHPFIKHDSFIDYRFTRLEAAAHVEDRVADGTFVAMDDCSPELVRRIISGALKSRRLPREYKKLLEKVLWP